MDISGDVLADVSRDVRTEVSKAVCMDISGDVLAEVSRDVLTITIRRWVSLSRSVIS